MLRERERVNIYHCQFPLCLLFEVELCVCVILSFWVRCKIVNFLPHFLGVDNLPVLEFSFYNPLRGWISRYSLNLVLSWGILVSPPMMINSMDAGLLSPPLCLNAICFPVCTCLGADCPVSPSLSTLPRLQVSQDICCNSLQVSQEITVPRAIDPPGDLLQPSNKGGRLHTKSPRPTNSRYNQIEKGKYNIISNRSQYTLTILDTNCPTTASHE